MSIIRTCAGALAAAAMGLALGACGGDDGDDSLARDIVLTPASGETPVAALSIFDVDDRTQVAAQPIGEDALMLVALMDRGLGATYRATYQTSSEEGEGDRYVVYNMPPLLRIDTLAVGSTTPSSIILLRGGSRSVNCTPAGDGWRCDEFDPIAQSALAALGPVVYPDAATLQQSIAREADPATIAGEAARCFELARLTGDALRYCLSTDGVPLRAVIEGQTVEATELSRDVSESDFELPGG
jgi:hypothetical protein